jgi:hypothetical protein
MNSVEWLKIGALLAAAGTIVLLLTTRERRTRLAFAVAILGSLGLCLLSVVISLCGGVDTGTHHCGAHSNDWAYVGIPFLFATAWLISRTEETLLWGVFFVVIAAAFVVPIVIVDSMVA